jgi:hypothetical protein
VPRGGSKVLVVKGTIAGISTSGPLERSGDLLKVDYDGGSTGLTGNYGTGVSSGNTITPSGSDTASDGVRVLKAYPTFAKITTGIPTTLTNGTPPLLRWSITANNGDVGVHKFTLRLATTTVTVTDLNVFAFTDADFTQGVSGVTSGGQLNSTNLIASGNTTWVSSATDLELTVTNSAGTAYALQIPSGATRYFEARATVASADASGDSVSTQLQGDNAWPTQQGGAGVGEMHEYAEVHADATAANNFAWSPNSTTTSSIIHRDWTNGYGVVGLPATNMTPQVLSR